jgi:hypothetical protein
VTCRQTVIFICMNVEKYYCIKEILIVLVLKRLRC